MFEGPHFLYGNGPGGLRGTASHGNPEIFILESLMSQGLLVYLCF